MSDDELIEKMALLTACESLPDEKALAVNDPAWKPRDALPKITKKESALSRVNE